MRTGGLNALRSLAAVVLAAAVLGAGCPLRQSDRAPDPGTWRNEVFLRAGGEETVDGGALTVSLLSVEPGNRLAHLTLRLRTATGSVEERIEVVRNTELSKAVRLDPYAVRVVGFPGVDSAHLLIERAGRPGEG